jgi:hypothetical protein
MTEYVKSHIRDLLFYPPDPILEYPMGVYDNGYDNPYARAAFAATGVPCICAVHPGQPKYWVVYFHGNSENLKLLYPFIQDLSETLDAHVFALEYEGYCNYVGGKRVPSERGCFGNADRFVEYIQQVAPVPVVFFCYSMGCAVGLHAAHTHKREKFPFAVILLAPFVSAASVKLATNRLMLALTPLWSPFDVFTMKRAALEQGHPIFVASGMNDEVIPPSHGRAIYELALKHGTAQFLQTQDTHASIRADPEGKVYPAVKQFLFGLPYP